MSRPDAILFLIAFFAYLAGFILFILHTALKREVLGRSATILMAAGIIPHSAALIVRWTNQGHVPLANMYEYMGLMAWMVVAGLLYFTYRYRNNRIGLFIAPVAVMLLVVASLLPSDINRQLVPALQSTWLAIHVTLAALGSGSFLVAFAAASLYLLAPPRLDGSKKKSPGSGFPFATFTAYWVALPIVLSLILQMIGVLPKNAAAMDGLHGASGSAITVNTIGKGAGAWTIGRWIIGMGIGMVLAAAVWPLVIRQRSRSGKSDGADAKFFIVLVLAVMISAVIIGFLVKGNSIQLTPNSYFRIFEFFGTVLAVSWLTTPLLHLLLIGSGDGWITRMGVSQVVLEDVMYAAVAIGYPLYTVGALFAGAIWAEQAWGTWWSWDPKEVGALIIWLFYTGFLHARYQRDWKGNPAAVLIVLGMVMVFVSFFGNYFFGGMHSFEVT